MSTQISPTSTLAPSSPQLHAADKAPAHNPAPSRATENDAEKGAADVNPYEGEGTEEKPYVVKWLPEDAENPQTWKQSTKWVITAGSAMSTLCVAFASSVYSGGVRDFLAYFGAKNSNVDTEIITLGVSLFVLGFAVGPLLWAPFSEQFGRRAVFIPTYFLFAVFHIGCALAKNIETLLICRFLAGFWGSAPLTNSGGIISDLESRFRFPASERALAMSLFALAPFAGPVLGPIVGGFLGISVSWRWIFWLLTIFSFVMWVCGALVPETYAPVLLRRRAAKLSKETGKVYRSMWDLHPSFAAPLPEKLKAALIRPFTLLFKETIVLLFSIYAAFIYGVLYLFFVAFPIIYQQEEGWNAGVGGLPFISVGIGMVLAVVANAVDNKRYVRKLIAAGGSLPPEARLPLCMIGGVVMPIGLFIYAWTASQPNVHYMVGIVFAAPFGFGMVSIFLAMMSYLIDAYLFVAASALAANAVIRSLFGFAFPLFGRQMFEGMGTNWALCFIAFIALALAPIPFVFYYYGARIRASSTFAPGHKPAAAPAASAPAPTNNSTSTLNRVISRQEAEAEDIANLDLAQVVSRKSEREKEMREGVLNEEAAEEAERREREEGQRLPQ
ncbi:hypothetical protein JCM11251_003593 [Rhodosporidiobolus azoricus]